MPAIEEEVRYLTTPRQRAQAPADAVVAVKDLGDRISIAITQGGRTVVRVYEDAERDCARRAQFASVLIVVTLMPSAEPEAEPAPVTPEPTLPPAPAPAPAPPAAPAAPSPPATRRVRIELAAVTDFSTPIGDSVRAVNPGAMLGVALGAHALKLTLSTSYAPSRKVELTGATAGSAELQHLDFGVGARYALAEGSVAASADLGLLASRSELRGLSAQRPEQSSAFSLGARAGFQVAFFNQALVSPFVGAHAKVIPFAPALTALPQGEVGHLPYCWLGLSAGFSLAL